MGALGGILVGYPFIRLDKGSFDLDIRYGIHHWKGNEARADELYDFLLRTKGIRYADNAENYGSDREYHCKYPRAAATDGDIKRIDEIHYAAYQQKRAQNKYDNGNYLTIEYAYQNADHNGGNSQHKRKLWFVFRNVIDDRQNAADDEARADKERRVGKHSIGESQKQNAEYKRYRNHNKRIFL